MPTPRRLLALTLLLPLTACCTTVPERPNVLAPAEAPLLTVREADGVRETILAQMDEQELVGLSCAIVRDGRIEHVEHFGYAERSTRTPVTDDTLFRWASISKPLTAVVAMQLATEGRLDLDADVRTYVPEFTDHGAVITARQLLCHQGGIVHYRNGTVVASTPPDKTHPFADPVDALTRFKDSPLVSAPGEAYNYTTHGYILLGAVVQRAGGAPYADLVRTRIAEPLGMTTLRPDYQWEDIPGRAVGYKRRAGLVVRSTNTDVSWKLPGGGFISNVRDLARFAEGLMQGQLVDDAARQAMWTTQTTANGDETSYGLGFTIRDHEGTRVVAHAGAQEKTRTLMAMVPDRRTAVCLMTNSEHASLTPIAHEILATLLTMPVAE